MTANSLSADERMALRELLLSGPRLKAYAFTSQGVCDELFELGLLTRGEDGHIDLSERGQSLAFEILFRKERR